MKLTHSIKHASNTKIHRSRTLHSSEWNRGSKNSALTQHKLLRRAKTHLRSITVKMRRKWLIHHQITTVQIKINLIEENQRNWESSNKIVTSLLELGCTGISMSSNSRPQFWTNPKWYKNRIKKAGTERIGAKGPFWCRGLTDLTRYSATSRNINNNGTRQS